MADPQQAEVNLRLDQAANYRTYLAWQRTILAFMLLGIAIQVFQLHIQKQSNIAPATFGLIVLGIITLAYVEVRCRRQAKRLRLGQFVPDRVAPALGGGMLILLVLIGSLLL